MLSLDMRLNLKLGALTLCLLVASAGSSFKQFGPSPRPRPTKARA